VSGWSAARRISAELELTGLSLTAHPLQLAEHDLAARGVTFARDLAALPDRTKVCVWRARTRSDPTDTLGQPHVLPDARGRDGPARRRRLRRRPAAGRETSSSIAPTSSTARCRTTASGPGHRRGLGAALCRAHRRRRPGPLRRGVPNGPMGRRSEGRARLRRRAGMRQKQQAAAETEHAAEEKAAYDARGTLRDAERTAGAARRCERGPAGPLPP